MPDTMIVTRIDTRIVPTPSGEARVHLHGDGAGLLVLGHGAGGGPGILDGVDLTAARDAALALGWRVAMVQQPWHVRGRKVAEPPPRLDAAWTAVLAELEGAPLVVGGRSAGARVACRTALQVGATAVLCLAFPLHPPGRPERSRLSELEGAGVPTLVVQGDRDAFGVPPGASLVPGADHSFRVAKGLPPAGPQVRALVEPWLAQLSQP